MEIMITLAIIGIMAAIGIPSILAGKPLRQLKSATRDVFGDFMKARSRAVATYRAHVVVFDTGARTFQIQEGEQGCMRASACASWSNVDLPKRLPTTTSIVGTPFGDDIASFNVDGTAEAGNITLQNIRGQQYQVTVSNTGRMQMRRL